MKALVINCSPVRAGATAEISKIISRCLGDRYEVRSICRGNHRVLQQDLTSFPLSRKQRIRTNEALRDVFKNILIELK